MKTIIMAIITVVALSSTFNATAQDHGELLIPFSNPSGKGKVRIEIRKGNVLVKGTSRKDVLVTYKGGESENENRDNPPNTEGLKRIDKGLMDLEVSEKNNYIEISSGSWTSDLDLVVEVPEKVDIQIETYNADEVKISNVSGEIVADNYNGEITAEDISGSIVANTYNGDIKAIFKKVAPDTPMAFTTYNGDVDLSLPSDLKASLKMKTVRGEIFSGFDLSISKSEPIAKTEKKSGAYKVYLDDWVKGDVNGGGAPFMIQNYNGDIFLRKN